MSGGNGNSTGSYSYCLELPPKMGSRGIMMPGYFKGEVMQYAVPQFLLQFIVMFFVTKSFHYVLKPFGLTGFTSQFLAGVALGVSGIGRFENIRKVLFPKFNEMRSHAEEILDAESVFAYTFFLFIVAVKMNMGMLFRVGRNSWVVGVSSILFPLAVGLPAIALVFEKNPWTESFKADVSLVQASMIVTQQSLTSFPVISWLLHDLKLLNTELGRLALSSSVVSYILSSLLLVVGTAITEGKPERICYTAVLIAGVVFVVRPGMLWVARNTPEGQRVKDIYLNILLILVFLFGVLSPLFGQVIFFGPIVLGFAVPEGPPLGSALVDKIETFFEGILLPIYVTSSVAKVNLDHLLAHPGNLSREMVLIAAVFAAKMVACIVPPLSCKVPFRDCLVLALILNCKGVVEVASYKYLHDRIPQPNETNIDDNRLALAMVATFISATMTPLAVRRLFNNLTKYGGYQQRNLMHLKPESELPVLVCIHRSDNIATSIKLLDSFSPTAERPIKLHVLHLLKLVGQFIPALISHNKQKLTERKSKSGGVIEAFKEFSETRTGAVSMNLFTAMSKPETMPEEICRLALDKHVSMIVLSFHKRWSKAGLISLEDTTIQAVNSMVLERAPCSVAIVVDRGYLCQPPNRRLFPLCISLFFLGGNDDREAVMLAKRMSRDPTTTVTVVHLCVKDEDGVISWDKMMDDEVLNDIKHGKCGDNVTYQKEYVEDGPQTALLVRGMAEKFNLMIVGRRHEVESTQMSGLREWMELPELGVLGDIIATTETTNLTSLLVIQQQNLQSKKTV